VLQKQDTPPDRALTVAHAVCHVAGALLGGDPKERALTWSLRDLTPVRQMGQGKTVSPPDHATTFDAARSRLAHRDL
jgi:hypothetical protein